VRLVSGLEQCPSCGRMVDFRITGRCLNCDSFFVDELGYGPRPEEEWMARYEAERRVAATGCGFASLLVVSMLGAICVSHLVV